MHRLTTTVLMSAAALTASTHAAITGVTGMATWLGTPPLSAQQFALTGMTAYCWDEQAGVSTAAAAVNLQANGTYTGFSPFTGVLSGTFDSHFIHFDPAPNAGVVTGTVTFSGTIVGVLYDESFLTLTDGAFGAGGTVYDTGNPLRSLSASVLGNNVLTINNNVLTFTLMTGVPGQANRMDEVRVFTQVPAPAGASLLGLAGLAGLRRRR
jgi:hypothetical protein